MLIKLTRVSCNAAGSKETKIWLNSYHIAKVEPCTIPGDKAKSYVSIKDEYAWRDIKVVETPEMIAEMVNHNRAELKRRKFNGYYTPYVNTKTDKTEVSENENN